MYKINIWPNNRIRDIHLLEHSYKVEDNNKLTLICKKNILDDILKMSKNNEVLYYVDIEENYKAYSYLIKRGKILKTIEYIYAEGNPYRIAKKQDGELHLLTFDELYLYYPEDIEDILSRHDTLVNIIREEDYDKNKQFPTFRLDDRTEEHLSAIMMSIFGCDTD